MDFAELFCTDTPLLDVRAPVEFAKGAFPNAINLPILDDEQRHLVGVCYKEKGPKAAEALGYELVGPIKSERIAGWQQFIAEHPRALLYCFRGGQRSQITEQWLAEAGTNIPRIPGGYKALRQFLLAKFEDLPPCTIISGKTGVGKTDLLNRFDNAVDLEGLANHRGSAFGRTRTEQPAQIDFENHLAIKLLKQPGSIVLEDESRLIGRISLPITLQAEMKRAPILLLKDTVKNRVQRILNEYVINQLAEMPQADGLSRLESEFMSAISAIQKRLGGDRYQQVKGLMKDAFAAHRTGDAAAHSEWIEELLVNYYDPMYEYQLEKKQGRIKQIVDWQNLPEQSILDFGSKGREVL